MHWLWLFVLRISIYHPLWELSQRPGFDLISALVLPSTFECYASGPLFSRRKSTKALRAGARRWFVDWICTNFDAYDVILHLTQVPELVVCRRSSGGCGRQARLKKKNLGPSRWTHFIPILTSRKIISSLPSLRNSLRRRSRVVDGVTRTFFV